MGGMGGIVMVLLLLVGGGATRYYGGGSGWCGALLVRVVDFGFVLLLWIFVVVAA